MNTKSYLLILLTILLLTLGLYQGLSKLTESVPEKPKGIQVTL